MITNPFEGEYRSLTAWELVRKYQDYKEGKDISKKPQTVGEWKQNLTKGSKALSR